MPHCIIEYSKSLESQIKLSSLVSCVHKGALTSGLFEASHIKTRSISYDYFQVGSEDLDFIHVTVRLHSGRTDTQKTMLSSVILEQLVNLELTAVAITVETVNIDTKSYAKQIM